MIFENVSRANLKIEETQINSKTLNKLNVGIIVLYNSSFNVNKIFPRSCLQFLIVVLNIIMFANLPIFCHRRNSRINFITLNRQINMINFICENAFSSPGQAHSKNHLWCAGRARPIEKKITPHVPARPVGKITTHLTGRAGYGPRTRPGPV